MKTIGYRATSRINRFRSLRINDYDIPFVNGIYGVPEDLEQVFLTSARIADAVASGGLVRVAPRGMVEHQPEPEEPPVKLKVKRNRPTHRIKQPEPPVLDPVGEPWDVKPEEEADGNISDDLAEV